MLWKRRHEVVVARSAAAVVVAVTATWLSFVLLGRTPDWNPWLRGPLLIAGARIVALRRVARRRTSSPGTRSSCSRSWADRRRSSPAQRGIRVRHGEHAAHGCHPHRGPDRRQHHGLRRTRRAGCVGGRFPGWGRWPVPRRRRAARRVPGGFGNGLATPRPGSARATASRAVRRRRRSPGVDAGRSRWTPERPSTPAPRSPHCSSSSTPTSTTWIAATTGAANSAAGYQLATDDPVMAIGGFNGSDPSPTLAQFQQYVRDGKVHWFISGGGFGGNRRRRTRHRWRPARPARRLGHLDVGERHLHRPDRGRRHGLRPHAVVHVTVDGRVRRCAGYAPRAAATAPRAPRCPGRDRARVTASGGRLRRRWD